MLLIRKKYFKTIIVLFFLLFPFSFAKADGISPADVQYLDAYPDQPIYQDITVFRNDDSYPLTYQVKVEGNNRVEVNTPKEITFLKGEKTNTFSIKFLPYKKFKQNKIIIKLVPIKERVFSGKIPVYFGHVITADIKESEIRNEKLKFKSEIITAKKNFLEMDFLLYNNGNIQSHINSIEYALYSNSNEIIHSGTIPIDKKLDISKSTSFKYNLNLNTIKNLDKQTLYMSKGRLFINSSNMQVKNNRLVNINNSQIYLPKKSKFYFKKLAFLSLHLSI